MFVKNNILSNTTGDHLFDASNCDTKEQSALMIPTRLQRLLSYIIQHTENVIKWSLGAGWSKVQISQLRGRYASVAAFNSETGFEAHGLALTMSPPIRSSLMRQTGILGSRWAAWRLDAVHHCNRKALLPLGAGGSKLRPGGASSYDILSNVV